MHFYIGRLWGDRLQKKFDRESSFEVRKMLGCLKCKYKNWIFIFRRLLYTPQKCFSSIFHLQILKQPEGVEGGLMRYWTSLYLFQNLQMKKRGETLFGECTAKAET